MKPFTSEEISGEALDHLGLVAAIIKKVRLQERIDKRLPIAKEKGAYVTMNRMTIPNFLTKKLEDEKV